MVKLGSLLLLNQEHWHCPAENGWLGNGTQRLSSLPLLWSTSQLPLVATVSLCVASYLLAQRRRPATSNGPPDRFPSRFPQSHTGGRQPEPNRAPAPLLSVNHLRFHPPRLHDADAAFAGAAHHSENTPFQGAPCSPARGVWPPWTAARGWS
ncbi:uncharacterized protein LOC112890690 [Panicum hallii]|uniref:uncharacterized protein LOC112890690 n=1 Tax=Panicum hallii TaxID=206008 RepID=UPI000DF4D59D|nr:uncharacterized protein LOC112890690 [Panicum hallii]